MSANSRERRNTSEPPEQALRHAALVSSRRTKSLGGDAGSLIRHDGILCLRPRSEEARSREVGDHVLQRGSLI
jgi:hypothetical protein